MHPWYRMGNFKQRGNVLMDLFKKKKPYMEFRDVIRYCKLMNYNINDILEMSDNELRIWYKRVLDMVSDETRFRIKTGISLDSAGKKHKTLAIVETRFHRRNEDG